jgi:hypothetical protein
MLLTFNLPASGSPILDAIELEGKLQKIGVALHNYESTFDVCPWASNNPDVFTPGPHLSWLPWWLNPAVCPWPCLDWYFTV